MVDTLRLVQTIIAANLGAPIDAVRPDSTAAELPGWDSLKHLVLVMEIEGTFGLQFAMDEIADLDSVSKIVNAVERRRAS
jgi:acyl carrier protein